MNKTLKALREQNNYSQAAVASFLDISRQMYIKYENGETEPPVKVVKILSDFYRVPYDVILEDKLNTDYEEKSYTAYNQRESTILEVHEPTVAYGTQTYVQAEQECQSYYLTAILEMLPKLIYKEQLKVLSKISDMVRNATDEKLKPNKQKSFYEELTELNNKYHPKSDGRGWTREEIYER